LSPASKVASRALLPLAARTAVAARLEVNAGASKAEPCITPARPFRNAISPAPRAQRGAAGREPEPLGAEPPPL